MKKYTVKEFAEHMGVSIKTLKHYEKYNIVVPEKGEENNYRYYSFKHGERILRSKQMINLGFSVRETSEHMTNRSMDTIINSLKKHEKEIQEEIITLELKQKRIQEVINQCELFKEKPNSWMIAKRKALYYLSHVVNNAFIEDYKIRKKTEKLMGCGPHAMKLTYFSEHIFEDMDKIDPVICLGIDATTAHSLKLDLSYPMVYLKEETCFLYIYSGCISDPPYEAILNTVLSKLKDEGFEPKGNVIVEGGLDHYSDEDRIVNWLIWVPINVDEIKANEETKKIDMDLGSTCTL